MIWLSNGDPMLEVAIQAILAASRDDGVYVSPVSAWEIGMLSNPRKGRPALTLLPDPKTWFTNVLAGPSIRDAPLTFDIAIDASTLPGDLHSDPADRLLIATARHLQIPIVTRDAKIIAYGKQGFVDVWAC